MVGVIRIVWAVWVFTKLLSAFGWISHSIDGRATTEGTSVLTGSNVWHGKKLLGPFSQLALILCGGAESSEDDRGKRRRYGLRELERRSRQMKKFIATVAIVLATGTAYGGDTVHTAGALLDDCEARERVIARTTSSAPYGVGTTNEIEKAASCFTYIDGFADGYITATAPNNGPGINFPEVVSSLDYVEIFVNYMLRHPELKSSPRFVGVYRALLDKYGEKK
jgi:hypothetical protein